MSGLTDLHQILGSLRPLVRPGRFVVVTAASEPDAPSAAQIVELRYFGGYSEVEIAGMLGISDRTLRRDWRKARAFLLAEMSA